MGDVIAQDSAIGIYEFALDHMGVKHEGVNTVTALKALFNVANNKPIPTTPRIAQDSGEFIKRFPDAARFRQA